MSRRVTVALVAIGGYGAGYVKSLLEPEYREIVEIVGAADPTPEHCPQLAELEAMNVPIRVTIEELYDELDAPPDLAIISSPIHWHARQTIAALSHGSNVLCEKPMCATVQEADAIIDARDRAGKFVSIGYQRSFTPAVQALKKDIRGGVLGRPKRLKCLCLGWRGEKYYGRNNWAGAMKSPEGAWVLDSPANNAMAHFVHHMFYILGPETDRSARPVRVTAELYRANDITNFDTCAIRATTDTGVEVLFYSSHAVDVKDPTAFRHEFAGAVVTSERIDDWHSKIVARFKDGSTKDYSELDVPHIPGKLREAVELAKSGGPLTCGPEAARSQTLCINAAHDSMPDVVVFPKSMLDVMGEPGDRVTFVPGLADVLHKCYEQNGLPSELGIDWAKPGKEIDLTDYAWFPGGCR